MFPCSECDKLLGSKRSLQDHKRKKHNFEASDLAKIFKCGHCEVVLLTRSGNLLRHLRNQHNSTGSYRCFSCPTYFGNHPALNQHQELYHSDISFGRASIDVSDLLDFTSEAVNSKYKIHRLKLENSGVLEPFNYLISLKQKMIAFVNSSLSTEPNVKLGISIAVKLEKALGERGSRSFLQFTNVSNFLSAN